jgi:hypothetical protein
MTGGGGKELLRFSRFDGRGRSQYFADGGGRWFDSTRPIRARGKPNRFVTSIFRRRCMMPSMTRMVVGIISP